MNKHLGSWWESLVVVGAPIFPYVGLFLLMTLGLLLLFVLLYWIYKLAKRLPPILRYSFWRLSAMTKRAVTYQPQRRKQQLSAVFMGDHRPIALDSSFGRSFGAFGARRRPPAPLFAVLGSSGSSVSSLLNLASGRSSFDAGNDPSPALIDVVWWQLEGRLALEVRRHLHESLAYTKRVQLLHFLERLSPVKPLDGVVVILSAKLLLERGDEQRAELMQLGRIVAEFNAVSGGRLPVYVVISGCECFSGFRGLVHASEGHFPENELHWLCPEGVPASEIENTLIKWRRSVEIEILRSVVVVQQHEAIEKISAVLALPGQIAQLEQPLLEWLKGITATTSNDQVAAVFSGVVLTGLKQPEQEGGAATSWGLRSLAPNLKFAKTSTYQPVARYVLRGRRLVALAVSLLLASLLLHAFWMPRTLSAIQGNVKALHAVAANAANFQLESNNLGGVASREASPHQLDRLLNAVAVTSKSSLWAVLVPSSWFEGSRSKLLAVLGVSAQKLLIEPRVKMLAQDRAALPAEAFLAVRSVMADRVHGLPAYGVLQEFLGSRELIGAAKDTAESLAAGVTYHDMIRFVGDDPSRFRIPLWSGSSMLPEEVVEHFDVSGLAHGGLVDQDMKSLMDGLWERLLQESLDFHPAVVLAQEVGVLADRLARDPTWSLDDAVNLDDRLRRLQQEVERPQMQRLLGTLPDALRFFSPAFELLTSSSIIPLPQRTDVSAKLLKRREDVRSRLLSYESDGIGRMFILDTANDRIKLSVEMKRFAASYSQLMSQSFMKQVAVTAVESGQANRSLSWNLAKLESLKELSAVFRDYATTGIQAFDPVLRSNLLRAARHQYRRTVDGVLVQSTRPLDRTDRSAAFGEPLFALREQAENIAGAARLYKLAISPDEETAISVAGELLTGQLLRALNDVEVRLSSENPYEPLVVDVQRWVLSSARDRSLASVMRGSPKERVMLARDYVRTQYGATAGLLLQALNGISPAYARDETVQRWRRLVDTLDAFDKGASANGLYELEQYILNLAKLNEPDDCGRFLSERAPVLWRSDYFSTRLAQLDETVLEACTQRTSSSKQKSYLLFSKWFNSQIAGHSPFSDGRRLTALTRRSFTEAMTRYRDVRKQLSSIPPDWPQPVVQFITQMDSLSVRFAALDSGKVATPGAVGSSSAGALQAKLQFRTNEAESVLGNQIIDLSVVAAGRQYGLRNTKDQFEWRIGEPMEVRLRWAANSPYTPVASKNSNDIHVVSGRTAIFQFTGDWAFFDLLQKHGARGDGLDTVVLHFSIPVVGPEGRTTTHVFLTLTSPDDQGAVALSFPSHAPGLMIEPAASIAAPAILSSRP